MYLNGFTTDGTTRLTAQVAGLYRVNYMGIGDGQNNHKYVTTVRINNVAQNCTESHKKMTAGGDIVTMTGSGFIQLNVNDNVTLTTYDDGDTGLGTYYGMNLNLVRIGD